MKEIVMRTLHLLLFLSFISPAALFPQISFERTYGGSGHEGGNSVRQTADGGYIIAGGTSSFGVAGDDVYLIKTNALGDTLWTRTYGGDDSDEGYSVQQTIDGGYIIAGLTSSYGAGGADVYLIKTDASGYTLWTRTYGGYSYDIGNSVQQTADGGFIIAGVTNSFGAGESNVYLIKTDTSGDTLWTKIYGSADDEEGYSVQQTTDGGYIITGDIFFLSLETRDVFLFKTDSSGDILWARTYGGVNNDWGKSVQQTVDGGYVIAGTKGFGFGNKDVYLIRTDSSGDTLWTRTYGGSDLSNSVQQTTDGGYIIAGRTSSFGAGGADVYLIKTDSAGDTLWTRTYGGDAGDAGHSVQLTTDGGYIITGSTASFGAGRTDVYLIKTDPDGFVGISDNIPPSYKLPRSWALSQNYPNPFNPTTTITFDVPGTQGEAQHVQLTVYNIRGKQVINLIDSEYEPGSHRVVWNGRNDDGEQVSSGIYLYTLKSEAQTYTKKMVMVK